MMKPGRQRLLTLLCTAAVIGAPLLLFHDVLGFEFLNYDDDIYVTGNPVVQSLHYRHLWAMVSQGYFRSYQPLTLLSHAIDYALWGPQAWGHHLTNLILHVCNSLLVLGLAWLIVRRRRPDGVEDEKGPETQAPWIPIVASSSAALLFAIHPLRVESVAWISDRKDLLMSLFLISSCAAYLLSRVGIRPERRTSWYWFSVALYVCGVLAKTVAVVLPLALLSLDLLLLPYFRWKAEFRSLLRNKMAFLALGIPLGLVAIMVGSGHTLSRFIRDLSPLEQLMIPAYSLGIYLTRTVLPVGLTPVYTAPSLEVLALMTAVVALVGAWLIRRREQPVARNILLAGWAFLLFILPALVGIVAKTGIQAWADRYIYFSSVPLFLLLGGGMATMLRSTARARFRRGALTLALTLALVMSATLAREYLPLWRASEGLWRAVISASPEISYGYNNLGSVLMSRGETQEALANYRIAQERDPGAPGPWFNMGLAYAQLGARDSAARYYREAIRCDTTYVDAYTALGTLALSEGDPQEARRLYEAALVQDPSSAKAHHNIGIICYQQGERSEAARQFELALASEPFSARTLLSLGVICSETGDHERARMLFRNAARLGSPEAQQLLAAENETW